MRAFLVGRILRALHVYGIQSFRRFLCFKRNSITFFELVKGYADQRIAGQPRLGIPGQFGERGSGRQFIAARIFLQPFSGNEAETFISEPFYSTSH